MVCGATNSLRSSIVPVVIAWWSAGAFDGTGAAELPLQRMLLQPDCSSAAVRRNHLGRQGAAHPVPARPQRGLPGVAAGNEERLCSRALRGGVWCVTRCCYCAGSRPHECRGSFSSCVHVSLSFPGLAPVAMWPLNSATVVRARATFTV